MSSDSPRTEQQQPVTTERTANEIEELIVPHGPKGECPNPELCVVLTEFRVAIEAEAVAPAGLNVKRLRQAFNYTATQFDLDHPDWQDAGWKNDVLNVLATEYDRLTPSQPDTEEATDEQR